MTTPPDGPPQPEGNNGRARRPVAGGGLAAPRPGGQTAAQSIAPAAAAEALLQSGKAAGKAEGEATAEARPAAEGRLASAAASSGAVVGQRAGVAEVQGVAAGRGRARGQGLGGGLAEGTGAAAPAVAVLPEGIGRRDREPAEPEPELEAGPAPATKPLPSQRPVVLMGVRAGQLVSWELALLTVALVYRERLSLLIPTTVAALLLIAVTSIRRRGRWLYQWIALWLRYRSRQRRRPVATDEAGPDEVATALLAAVVRGAEIVAVEIEEADVALISHAGGLIAVLEVSPWEAGHVVEPSQMLPPLPTLLPPAEVGEPVISVQVVVQSIPAPNFAGLADSAAISYRELAGGVVPATRGCWLAVQAQHVAEQYTATGLQESVVRAVTRLQRRLRKSGLRARLLNRNEIASELLQLVRVDISAPPAKDGRRTGKTATPAVQESWKTWSAGPQVHTTFRLLDWPDLAEPAGRELLDRLVHTPTLATTVSVAARQHAAAEDVELEAAIRVTIPNAGVVDAVTQDIRAIVEGVGGRVERLDGEHVFGVAATLPLGGFLS